MLDTFNVRQLVDCTDFELAQLPGMHRIIFDDGSTVDAYRNETRYSRVFWDLFKPYPNAIMTYEHHISTVLRGKDMSSDTHQAMTTNILRSIVHDVGLRLPEQKEPLLDEIYKTISNAQKYLALVTEADVISLDILDFVRIKNHPNIKALHAGAMADKNAVEYAYKMAEVEIMTNPDFDNNNLAKAVRAGMVRINQVVQCVLFRGYLSEVDGTYFEKAVWSNYTSGVRGFFESAADSRTAAKSHIYSDTALKDSEYNARRFQLYAVVLERVIFEDCGSTTYKPWIVRGKVLDAKGVVKYGGDLPLMKGKHYTLDPKDHNLLTIKGNEEHLVGKVIYVRSIQGCRTPNPHEVCHVCVGKLSDNISRFDNIGHAGTVAITKVLSQTILSFKHVIVSAEGLVIILGKAELEHFNTGPVGNMIFLNPKKPKVKKVTMSIAPVEAPGLGDLSLGAEIQQLSLSRISSLKNIKLSYVMHDGSVEEHLVDVRVKDKPTLLSRELLNYLAVNGWTLDEDNNFLLDLEGWDVKQPLLVMENKEESVVDLVKAVETLVQSNQDLHKKRMLAEDAGGALLQDLFDLVNSRFKINFLCFEVMIYGLLTDGPDSYALARNSANPTLGISDSLVMHRSMGSMLTYQEQSTALFHPGYFFSGTRPDSIMDVFLCPQDVVTHYHGPQG